MSTFNQEEGKYCVARNSSTSVLMILRTHWVIPLKGRWMTDRLWMLAVWRLQWGEIMPRYDYIELYMLGSNNFTSNNLLCCARLRRTWLGATRVAVTSWWSSPTRAPWSRVSTTPRAGDTPTWCSCSWSTGQVHDGHNSVSKSNVSPVCRSSLVNERQEDKTALQVAAHEGHTQVSDVMCKTHRTELNKTNDIAN